MVHGLSDFSDSDEDGIPIPGPDGQKGDLLAMRITEVMAHSGTTRKAEQGSSPAWFYTSGEKAWADLQGAEDGEFCVHKKIDGYQLLYRYRGQTMQREIIEGRDGSFTLDDGFDSQGSLQELVDYYCTTQSLQDDVLPVVLKARHNQPSGSITNLDHGSQSSHSNLSVRSGASSSSVLKRRFVLKEVDGSVLMFDQDTGELIYDLGKDLAETILKSQGGAQPQEDEAEFSWHGDERGWCKNSTDRGVVGQADWTIPDVSHWMQFTNNSSCVDACEKEGVDGHKLQNLDPDELLRLGQEYGIDDDLLKAGCIFHAKALKASATSRSPHTAVVGDDDSNGEGVDQEYKWLIENTTRDAVTNILQDSHEGNFIVWSTPEGQYFLSAVHDGEIHEKAIGIEEDGCYFEDSEHIHDSIVDMINFHSTEMNKDLDFILKHDDMVLSDDGDDVDSGSDEGQYPAWVDQDAVYAAWYKPNMSPSEAAGILTPGAFLVHADNPPHKDKAVLSYFDEDGELQHKKLYGDGNKLRVEGSRFQHDTLSAAIHVLGSNNDEFPNLLKLQYGADSHQDAFWYFEDLTEKEANDILVKRSDNLKKDGAFVIRKSEWGHYMLHFVVDRQIRMQTISDRNGEVALSNSKQKFSSLMGLVAHYIYVPHEALGTLLSPVIPRGMEEFVDKAAEEAPWYLGSVSEKEAEERLQGGEPGQYVVIEDDQGLQVLNIDDEMQIARHYLEADEHGLHIEGEEKHFETLTDLVLYYTQGIDPRDHSHWQNSTDSSEDGGAGSASRRENHNQINRAAMPQQIEHILESEAPLTGPKDHLTAPWMAPETSREELMHALRGQPDGSFFVRQDPNDFSLFVIDYVFANRLFSAPVHQFEPRQFCFVGDEKTYPSLAALVAHQYIEPRPYLQCPLLLPAAPHHPYTGEEPPTNNTSWNKLDQPRKYALKCLQGMPDGAFIVRQSRSTPGCFALSYMYRGMMYHELIGQQGDSFFVLCAKNPKPFDSLEELVTYYSYPREELHTPLIPYDVANPPFEELPREAFIGGHPQQHQQQDLALRPSGQNLELQSGPPANRAIVPAVSEPQVRGSSHVQQGPGWLQLGVSPEQADMLLTGAPDGKFAVYDHSNNQYVLAYAYRNQVCYEPIFRDEAGFFLPKEAKKTFNSLPALVKHYQTKREELACALRPEHYSTRSAQTHLSLHAQHEVSQLIGGGQHKSNKYASSNSGRQNGSKHLTFDSLREQSRAIAGSSSQIHQQVTHTKTVTHRQQSQQSQQSRSHQQSSRRKSGGSASGVTRGTSKGNWLQSINRQAAMNALNRNEADFIIHDSDEPDAFKELSLLCNGQAVHKAICGHHRSIHLRHSNRIFTDLYSLATFYTKPSQDLPRPLKF